MVFIGNRSIQFHIYCQTLDDFFPVEESGDEGLDGSVEDWPLSAGHIGAFPITDSGGFFGLRAVFAKKVLASTSFLMETTSISSLDEPERSSTSAEPSSPWEECFSTFLAPCNI